LLLPYICHEKYEPDQKKEKKIPTGTCWRERLYRILTEQHGSRTAVLLSIKEKWAVMMRTMQIASYGLPDSKPIVLFTFFICITMSLNVNVRQAILQFLPKIAAYPRSNIYIL